MSVLGRRPQNTRWPRAARSATWSAPSASTSAVACRRFFAGRSRAAAASGPAARGRVVFERGGRGCLPCATRAAIAGPPRRRAGARRRTRRSSRRAGRQVLLVFDERVDVPASRLDLVRGSARDEVDPERAAAVLAAGRPSLKREGCPKRLERGGATCRHIPPLQRGFEVPTRARARGLSVLLCSFSGSARGTRAARRGRARLSRNLVQHALC